MNIQRLKFAQARGARIQWISSDWHSDQKWYDCLRNDEEFASTKWADSSLRLHPEDEHLQYGPLSTAVRETVINRYSLAGFNPACSVAVAIFPELGNEWWDLDGEDRLMQFLFLAELLADEGL